MTSERGTRSPDSGDEAFSRCRWYQDRVSSGMGNGQPFAALPALRLLVVDDDVPLREACCKIASQMGFIPLSAGSVSEALTVMKHQLIDMLLLDLKLPGEGGLKLLREVKAAYPNTRVIIITAHATVSSAVQAMRIGACDYVTKPFALKELAAVFDQSSRRLQFDLESRGMRERLRTLRGMGTLIGTSPAMEKVYRLLAKIAFATHPVLILGESGTGKELVARLIHSSGPNAAKPFIPLNCGSLVPTLIESKLFGHVKGAFTGAIRAKKGLFVAAEGGTLFLDEIGELSMDLQTKLLRALQEGEVHPVGATNPLPISARVLAATNHDLNAMVAQGLFRKDLYLRLNVVNLKIPPLRERREDIVLLAEHFLEYVQVESGNSHSFSEEATRFMTEYDWPGNVRELKHTVEGTCAMSFGPILHVGDLPSQIRDFRTNRHAAELSALEAADGLPSSPAGKNDDIVSIPDMEKRTILDTIRQLNGDKLMAPRLLGIGKTTLYRKLKEYGIAEVDRPMNNQGNAEM
jgi:DNA-binding NtrC family response regulator